MELERNTKDISVTWRGKKYVVTMNLGATLEELGQELQKLTAVKSDTLKLIVQSKKSSKLLSPFSDEHSRLTLQETSIVEGKPIRMMGVPKEEIDQVLKNEKMDMRIIGFDEEEKRNRQRISNGFDAPLKLPQGNYVFGDFKTLELPGIELNPPPSEALRLMHTLAADRGIVAIMNKHKWRVGIMTEMAPEGYVGVSPVCILGFNKNHGEEISLRLRTDDLKGFRKYQSIKKTLLHELAHMVYSEHDAKFYALDSQLNKEAEALDWTRSGGHSLNGPHKTQHEPEFHVSDTNTYGSNLSHKLGGNRLSNSLANARASSVAAAYQRLLIASTKPEPENESDPDHHNRNEPDPDDDKAVNNKNEPDPDDNNRNEPDPDDDEAVNNKNEPDPDNHNRNEPDPDDHNRNEPDPDDSTDLGTKRTYEPDPDDHEAVNINEPDPDDDEAVNNKNEPDPDDLMDLGTKQTYEPDPDDSNELEMSNLDAMDISEKQTNEPDPDDCEAVNNINEPDPDDNIDNEAMESEEINEVGPDDGILCDEELQRIQDPVLIACNRLKKSIEALQSEVSPVEAALVFQTLVKIVKNVIEHPGETKFKKLRKANPVIQKNIASYNGAMEILFLIGFCEDIVQDEIGRAEAYLVLKRNDPGLLWLAKSSLETCITF